MEPAAKPRLDGTAYDPGSLALPQGSHWKELAREGERHGVQAAIPDTVTGRRTDQPIVGDAAVYQRDEREAKYGRPDLLISRQPGRPPLMIVGAGQHTTEELKEWADEAHHYGTEVEKRRPRDINKDIQEVRERQAARRNGRTVYGGAGFGEGTITRFGRRTAGEQS